MKRDHKHFWLKLTLWWERHLMFISVSLLITLPGSRGRVDRGWWILCPHIKQLLWTVILLDCCLTVRKVWCVNLLFFSKLIIFQILCVEWFEISKTTILKEDRFDLNIINIQCSAKTTIWLFVSLEAKYAVFIQRVMLSSVNIVN